MYRWLISARPPVENKKPVEYLPGPSTEPEGLPAGEMLLQYPYLASLECDWLDQHDQDGIARVDEFLILHGEAIEYAQAAHDLSIWLLDQVVLTIPGSHWIFRPYNTCAVQVGNNDSVMLDPYRTVLHRLENRHPITDDLMNYAQTLTGA